MLSMRGGEKKSRARPTELSPFGQLHSRSHWVAEGTPRSLKLPKKDAEIPGEAWMAGILHPKRNAK